MRRIAIVLAVAAGAGLALAGCAALPSSSAPPQGLTFSPQTVVRPADIDGQTPHAYAESQVLAMLRTFVAPPGARGVNVSPSEGLDDVEASTTAIDKNLVDQFADWVAPGTPAHVLAMAARHLPARYEFIGSGSSGRGRSGAPVLDDVSPASAGPPGPEPARA